VIQLEKLKTLTTLLDWTSQAEESISNSSQNSRFIGLIANIRHRAFIEIDRLQKETEETRESRSYKDCMNGVLLDCKYDPGAEPSALDWGARLDRIHAAIEIAIEGLESI